MSQDNTKLTFSASQAGEYKLCVALCDTSAEKQKQNFTQSPIQQTKNTNEIDLKNNDQNKRK